MKVLILAGYFPKSHNPAMGAWALEQAKAIQREGVEVTVVSPTPWIPRVLCPTTKLKAWASIPTEYVWDGIRTYYPKGLFFPVSLGKELYARFPSLQYYPVCCSVRKLLSLIKWKPDLIYAHHPLIEGLVGLKLKEIVDVPLVIIEHSLTDIQRALRYRYRRKLYTDVLRNADAVITVSDRLANLMRQFVNSELEISVIRNGVDITALPAKRVPKPPAYKDNKVVLSVGWLAERKGHRILIQAIKKIVPDIPSVKCIIVGQGPQGRQLRNLIEQLDLEEHVELTGNMPHRDLLSLMAWCDVFALPSWDEPFPTVFPEAMGCGTPIIGTKGEGIAEVVEDGKQGLLVPPKDVDSLAKALMTLLKNDDLARRMGEEGRKLVLKDLSWQANAAKTISVFEKLLAR